jgi:hypothetical protein
VLSHISAIETRMNRGLCQGGGAWEASALPLSYTRVASIPRAFAKV